MFGFVEPERACSYLPTETASLEYRFARSMPDEQFEQMLRRGWRRFSTSFFRPRCPACVKCRSLRVNVTTFRDSKSQRRCLQRNESIRVQVGEPTLTQAHLELFNRYHADMQARRGWPTNEFGPEDYVNAYLSGDFRFLREFRYVEDHQLVGIGLVDVVGQSSSSVYFYHAPEWRSRGPGVFSMLREIHFAREQGIRYHYLGYWIAESQSMAYKSQFGPHELLRSHVSDDEEPVWNEVAESH